MPDGITILHNTGTGTRILTAKVTVTGGFTVDWGDGNIINYASAVTASKTYATPSTNYTAIVYAQVPANTITGFSMTSSTTCINIEVTLDTPGLTNTLNMFNGLTNKLKSFNSITTLNSVSNATAMFYGCNSITSISLPSMTSCTNIEEIARNCSAVTTITGLDTISINTTSCANSFNSCTALTTMPALPVTMNSVTSCSGMFMGCNNLVGVVAMPSMTSNKNISYMFYACYKVTSITGLDTMSTAMVSLGLYYAFYNCNALTTMPALPATMNLVTTAKQLFYYCNSITGAVTIPSMSACKDVSEMFTYCEKITSISGLENISTAATTFYYTFAYCTYLNTKPTLPATLNSVTTVQRMFYNCSNLVGVVAMPSMTSCSNITEFANGCAKMTSITGLNTMSTSVSSLLNSFYGCTALTSMPALPATLNSVTTAEGTFQGCANLAGVIAMPSMTACKSLFNFANGCSKVTSITGLNNISTLTTTIAYAFQNCSLLESVPALPATLNSVTTCEGTFWGCGSMTGEANMPSMTACKNIYGMFVNCSGITRITGLNTMHTGMTSAAVAFWGCRSITEMPALPATLNSLTSIAGMFIYCNNLEGTIAMPSMTSCTNISQFAEECYKVQSITGLNNTGNVTDMSRTFYECRALQSAPALKGINTAVTTISKMFYNCYNLEGVITLPIGMLSCTDAEYAFYGCTKLTGVDNLDDIGTTYLGKVAYMFKNCVALTTVPPLPASIDYVTDITEMYAGCTGLTTITLPALPRVNNATGMFSGCTALTTLNNLSNLGNNTTTQQTGTIGIDFMKNCYEYTGVLNVSATAWKQFGAYSSTITRMKLTGVTFSNTLNKWADSSGYAIKLMKNNFTAAAINTLSGSGNLPAGASKHIDVNGYYGNGNSYTTPNNGWIISGVTGYNTQYQKSLSATLKTYPFIMKTISIRKPVNVRCLPTIQKDTSTSKTANIKVTSTNIKGMDKILSAKTSVFGSFSKQVGKIINNTVSIITNMVKGTNKELQSIIHTSTTTIKETSKKLLTNIVVSSMFIQAYNVILSCSVKVRTSISKGISKLLTSTVQVISNVVKNFNLMLSCRLEVTTNMVKRINKSLLANVYVTASNIKQTYKNIYTNVKITGRVYKLFYVVLTSLVKTSSSLIISKQFHLALTAFVKTVSRLTIKPIIASILTNIKTLLGIREEDTSFDIDIIMSINSALFNLKQLGVGPKRGLVVQDKETRWAELIGSRSDLEAVKSYVYSKVQLTFDPPQLGYTVDSIKEQIKELEWRINSYIEINKTQSTVIDDNIDYEITPDTSILTSIKSSMGIIEEDESFDEAILIHINNVMFDLNQLAVGPEYGFVVRDKYTTWTEFVPDRNDLNSIRTYVYLKIRLVFDPPQMGFLLTSIKDQIKELEWRINGQAEYATIESDEVDDTEYVVTQKTSILLSIKKLLGVNDMDTNFDVAIKMHINSALDNLNQLGIGPSTGLSIKDASTTWNNLIQDRTDIEIIKYYVYLKVRLVFDPPQMGYLVKSIEEQITEYEWRISINAEGDEFDG